MQASSDNNTAELLLKELGVASGGGGTWRSPVPPQPSPRSPTWGSTPRVSSSTTRSGLSTNNRVHVPLLAGILERYEPGDQFAAGLPVAGQDGTTLSDVFVGSAVEGRLIGKTGTLHNEPYNADPPAVKALSGYVPVEGGGTIEYAFVLNSAGTLPEQTVYRPIWDAFAEVLASYPSGPTAAELGPG